MTGSESLKKYQERRLVKVVVETPTCGHARTMGQQPKIAAAVDGAGLGLGDKPCVLLVAELEK